MILSVVSVVFLKEPQWILTNDFSAELALLHRRCALIVFRVGTGVRAPVYAAGPAPFFRAR